MGGVECIGGSITGTLSHLNIVVALILILLEEWQAANLKCLRLILDLAVDDLKLEQLVFSRIHFLDFINVWKLLPGRIYFVVVGVRDVKLVLGRLIYLDPGLK